MSAFFVKNFSVSTTFKFDFGPFAPIFVIQFLFGIVAALGNLKLFYLMAKNKFGFDGNTVVLIMNVCFCSAVLAIFYGILRSFLLLTTGLELNNNFCFSLHAVYVFTANINLPLMLLAIIYLLSYARLLKKRAKNVNFRGNYQISRYRVRFFLTIIWLLEIFITAVCEMLSDKQK